MSFTFKSSQNILVNKYNHALFYHHKHHFNFMQIKT